MGRLSISVFWCLVVLGIAPALAQSAAPSFEKITVSSPLAQDYAIAGTLSVPSGGAGLFMRKGRQPLFVLPHGDSEIRNGLDPILQTGRVAARFAQPVILRIIFSGNRCTLFPDHALAGARSHDPDRSSQRHSVSAQERCKQLPHGGRGRSTDLGRMTIERPARRSDLKCGLNGRIEAPSVGDIE